MAWLKQAGCGCDNCAEDPCAEPEESGPRPVVTSVVRNRQNGAPLAYPADRVLATGADSGGYQVHTSLPAGLSFNTTDGYFYGTLPDDSTLTFLVSASNACGRSYGTVTYITADCEVPTVDDSSASGEVLTSFSHTLTATGHGYGTLGFEVLPGLPAGLSLNALTGVISGTPTQPFAGHLTIRVNDGCGAGYGILELDIADSEPGTPPCGGCSLAPFSLENSTSEGSDSSACSAGDSYVGAHFPCARALQAAWDVSAGSVRIEVAADGVTILDSGYVSGTGAVSFIVPAGTEVLSFDIFCSVGGATFTIVFACL